MKTKDFIKKFIQSGYIVWGFYFLLCFIFWDFPYGLHPMFNPLNILDLNYDFAYGILRAFLMVHIVITIIRFKTEG